MVMLVFPGVLLLTFLVMAVATRPSQDEKTMARRIAALKLTMEDGEATPDARQLLKATNTGRFGWFENLLEQFQFSQQLQIRIMQANSSTTVGTVVLGSIGLAVLGYAVAYFFAPIIAVDIAAAGLLGFVPYAVLSFKRSRRIAAFNMALPESIDMMARALRAGHSMVGAIEMLAEQAVEPAGSEFGEVFNQQNLGLPLREALMQLLDRVPSQDLRVLVTAILVQKDTGGNLAEILDRTVFVIRERLRIRGEIRVHTAQGRMTGWILSLLPIVMLVLINLVNPGYSKVLLDDPFGRKLCYLGIGLIVIGSLTIRHIINGIEV